MPIKNPWKTLSSKQVYRNPWIKVREDRVIRPDGQDGIFGVVEIRPAVIIIPLNERKETYLIGQWRYTINSYSWELPAGLVEEGESPLMTAKRELLEEAKLKANQWSRLGYFYLANGALNQKAYIFLARGLSPMRNSIGDPTEKLKIKKIPFRKAINLVMENKITDDLSITAILKAKEFLKKQP